MKPRVDIITLAVDNLETSLAFYRDGLGLPTQGILDGEDHVAFELDGGITLVLYPRTELARMSNETGEVKSSVEFILSHAASSREEVDTILGRARSAGATIPAQPQEEPWGYSGYFKDPDGHLWEILWGYAFESSPEEVASETAASGAAEATAVVAPPDNTLHGAPETVAEMNPAWDLAAETK